MTKQPENLDPIQSAGQIDDPDQPTTIAGRDDSRAGRDTQPAPVSAERSPQTGAASASAATNDEEDRGPRKAVKETGFPNVGDSTLDEFNARDVDSEALAGRRKFQPRAGDVNPNFSSNPADRAPAEPSDHEHPAASYESAQAAPITEPVRHSRMVEENVREQEREFDLGTDEDGERYLVPKNEEGR